VFAASVAQINALVNTILASTLVSGSISWLYYADRLLELPVGLVAVALGTVILPHLSTMVARNDQQRFSATLDWGVHLGLLLGLPAAVALWLLAKPLVAVMFTSFGGAMTEHDVRMAAAALEMFAIALPGFVLVKVLQPGFFRAPRHTHAVSIRVHSGGGESHRQFGNVQLDGSRGVGVSHRAVCVDSSVAFALWPYCQKALSDGQSVNRLGVASAGVFRVIGRWLVVFRTDRCSMVTDAGFATDRLARGHCLSQCTWLRRSIVVTGLARQTHTALGRISVANRQQSLVYASPNAPILGVWKSSPACTIFGLATKAAC
jgi:hypothetical protein